MAAMRLFWQSRNREAQTRFLYCTWVQKKLHKIHTALPKKGTRPPLYHHFHARWIWSIGSQASLDARNLRCIQWCHKTNFTAQSNTSNKCLLRVANVGVDRVITDVSMMALVKGDFADRGIATPVPVEVAIYNLRFTAVYSGRSRKSKVKEHEKIQIQSSKKFSSAKNFVKSDPTAVCQDFIFIKRAVTRLLFGRSVIARL